jgi:uncharacterized protein YdhG (YjbR/CyaY superfamily)
LSLIDDYLKTVEPVKRKELERIRALAKAAVPSAEEPFLGFNAHKDHIGIYPYSGHVIETLKDELKAYSSSKGAIRVPLDRPISKTTLRKIIDRRLRAIRAETEPE